jgi:hypothetical protein
LCVDPPFATIHAIQLAVRGSRDMAQTRGLFHREFAKCRERTVERAVVS